MAGVLCRNASLESTPCCRQSRVVEAVYSVYCVPINLLISLLASVLAAITAVDISTMTISVIVVGE